MLERLPGHAIDVPALAYIEVVTVTGTAAIVAEGAGKPELLMPADQKTATARKIAAHVVFRGKAIAVISPVSSKRCKSG